MNKTYKLPEGFKFGSSASAFQTEGRTGKKAHQENYVDMMYKDAPERWYQGIGPTIATDFYNRYEEDIHLMKELGIQVYRTSIDWSRMITNYETNEIDSEAFEYYTKMIDCLIENGIQPMLCLEHWEVPKYLVEKYGSWQSEHVKALFVEYGKKMIDLFHEKVKVWWTINEPIVVPSLGYMTGEMYPYIEDAKMATQMNYYRVLATAELVQYFKEKEYDGQIGIILNPSPAYPKCKENPYDVWASRVAELFDFRLYMDPLIKGQFADDYIEILKEHDIMFNYRDIELETIKNNPIQVLGINYYQPQRVKQRAYAWNPEKPFQPEYYYEKYSPLGVRMNFSRGWEIYPKGIYDMLKTVQNEYGNIECWITENGMGVEGEDKFKNEEGIIQDDYRIEFLSEHMAWMLKAIDEGANCKGFLNWTFTDNLSPRNAFKNRYGFVEIDLNDNRNRRIKKSGYWVKELMETREFESVDLKPEYK